MWAAHPLSAAAGELVLRPSLAERRAPPRPARPPPAFPPPLLWETFWGSRAQAQTGTGTRLRFKRVLGSARGSTRPRQPQPKSPGEHNVPGRLCPPSAPLQPPAPGWEGFRALLG